jgi:hypothetical protein
MINEKRTLQQRRSLYFIECTKTGFNHVSIGRTFSSIEHETAEHHCSIEHETAEHHFTMTQLCWPW